MARRFEKAFAESGDKVVVPNATQIDGSVSYETGYGFDYERDPDPLIDPLTKDIERDKMNQLFYDITLTLKQLQESGGAPEWYESIGFTVGYPKGARVIYGGYLYESTEYNNGGTPGFSATWVQTTSLDATLVSIGNLDPIANQMIYFTALNEAAVTAITSFGRSLIGQANSAGALSVLGLGNATEAATGVVRMATITETVNGTVGNIAVKPQHLVQGYQRFGNSTAGGINYPQFMGSHQRRWGVVTVPGGSNNFIVGLLHTTQCLNVIVSLGFSSSGDFQPPKAEPSGQGIRISNSDSNSVQVRYLTEGY